MVGCSLRNLGTVQQERQLQLQAREVKNCHGKKGSERTVPHGLIKGPPHDVRGKCSIKLWPLVSPLKCLLVAPFTDIPSHCKEKTQTLTG